MHHSTGRHPTRSRQRRFGALAAESDWFGQARGETWNPLASWPCEAWHLAGSSSLGRTWLVQAKIFHVTRLNDEELPVPPLSMRQLVGPTDLGAFQNLDRQNIFPNLPSSTWESVIDFGSGCGRLARRMMLQKDAVKKYVGLDLHKGMVDWCQANLTLANHDFTFIHHNAFNLGLNPSGTPHPQALPFNIPSETATLVIAWSVFTHLVESQVMDYLLELKRLMRPGADLFRHGSFLIKATSR